jgi:hypothetical protein
MDRTRAIHPHVRDQAAFHEIDQLALNSRAQYVCSHQQERSRASPTGRDEAFAQCAQAVLRRCVQPARIGIQGQQLIVKEQVLPFGKGPDQQPGAVKLR